MKWTVNQVAELHDLCMAEKSNAELAEHFGVPVTEIHAKRSQLGITIPKIAAMKDGPALTVEPEFERAVQEKEKELTPEQAKKLLNAIFDTPDEEPEDDNYPETASEKVGYSEFVLTHSLQYIGKALHRLCRLSRLMALKDLPNIIMLNELRMALEPLLQVENDVKDILELLMPIYKAAKKEAEG